MKQASQKTTRWPRVGKGNSSTKSDHNAPAPIQASVYRGVADSGSETSPTQSPSRSQFNSPASISLAIDQLVLHGSFAGDRKKIGQFVQDELSRLLSEQGLAGFAKRSTTVSHLDVGSFSVSERMSSRQIGREIARVIYRGLSR